MSDFSSFNNYLARISVQYAMYLRSRKKVSDMGNYRGVNRGFHMHFILVSKK
jgi:hypothetical protein